MFKNRTLQTFLIALALIVGVLYASRAQVSVVLFERMVEYRMSNSIKEGLVDGLHLVLCGAGAPLPDPERAGPCVLVIAGQTMWVIDAGSGGSRNLMTMGVPQGDIEGVLLTHFHSDHIDGLGELAMQRWVNGANTAPMKVIGPEGVSQVVEGFNMAYALDAEYRQAHHGDEVAPLSGRGMRAIEFKALAPGKQNIVIEEGGLKVTMFSVDHEPIRPAVAYRFDYKGRSLVISGDTSKSENLQAISQGVDLLVHEALAPNLVMAMNRAAVATDNAISEKVTRDILDYHTSPQEAAEIAHAVKAKHLLFYHIVPALVVPGSHAAFLNGVSEAYQGSVTIGKDGTMISLPSNSQEVRSKELL